MRLGTPALILDVELPTGGQVTTPVPAGFQGFAYVLDGEAAFGDNRRRARPAQLVLLGPGTELAVTDATPGTRFLLMTGQPYGEAPHVQRPVRGLARQGVGSSACPSWSLSHDPSATTRPPEEDAGSRPPWPPGPLP